MDNKEAEQRTFLALYKRGMIDRRIIEIARCDQNAVRNMRRRNHLPANKPGDIIKRGKCAGTLCWLCSNVYDGEKQCCWMQSHGIEPVPGWTAEEREFSEYYKGRKWATYLIFDCPLFSIDERINGGAE